jgi:hypothetical protein
MIFGVRTPKDFIGLVEFRGGSPGMVGHYLPVRARKSGHGALGKNAANKRRPAGGGSAWSAERRSVPNCTGRAVSLARGRGRFGAPLPSLRLVRERRAKGVPGAFSNNTGDDAWLFEI